MSALTPDERTRVGRLLRRQREAQTPRLNQADIAEKIGKSIGTVQNIEDNKRKVDRDTIEKYAALFGTTVEQLLRPDAVPIQPSDPRLADLTRENLDIARRFTRATTPVRMAVKGLLAAADDPIAEEIADVVTALRHAADHDQNIAYWTSLVLDYSDLITQLAHRLDTDPQFEETIRAFLDDNTPKGKK